VVVVNRPAGCLLSVPLTEDVVQLIGVLWFQIPFKDFYLYTAIIPGELEIFFYVRRVDPY
jgi:hypothetical protein